MEKIEFRLNGRPTSLETEADWKLLWVLRSDLALTGAKYGCGIGLCGACTVLIDEEAFRSCQVPVGDIRGKEVITIEGLARGDVLHPLQKAFLERQEFQCGFCTPGMILNAYSLLRVKPNPSRDEIITGMEGNLCRCGAHPRIVEAIRRAALEMRGGPR